MSVIHYLFICFYHHYYLNLKDYGRYFIQQDSNLQTTNLRK